ncbi:hypothetical protein J1N35_019370 [Gossypium stocksii]|uniref:Uncharacterized protein n=1 Tax=Gossypium stocksii TaxID=47602 RepID=A0A9D3VSD6_9ROSI|nr:hypothetical protein J1N35_019370 [Gossypium stocksii]
MQEMLRESHLEVSRIASHSFFLMAHLQKKGAYQLGMCTKRLGDDKLGEFWMDVEEWGSLCVGRNNTTYHIVGNHPEEII